MEPTSSSAEFMPSDKKPVSPVADKALEWFYRLAASGYIPRRWFGPDFSSLKGLTEVDGKLTLEIVSHCWNYANIITYQLGSLVLFPPREINVIMTVFFTPEDRETREVLEYYGQKNIPGVTWNWRALPGPYLLRRAYGRNLAAKNTRADWIFFTDCDVLFREKSLDLLGKQLRDREDLLVYPRYHMVSELLSNDDPLFEDYKTRGMLRDIEPHRFYREERNRAVGAFQIVRGDAARLGGYCDSVRYYHRPVKRWRKTYEDRTFRWLLGTQGTMLEIPGFYRIRHTHKGRKGKKVGVNP